MAELWGLSEGLRLCHGLCRLRVEMDSKAMIDVMMDNKFKDGEGNTLVEDCLGLVAGFEQVSFSHIP